MDVHHLAHRQYRRQHRYGDKDRYRDGDEQPLEVDRPAENVQAHLLGELKAQSDAERAADQAQQHALAEQLAHHEPVLGAQRLL